MRPLGHVRRGGAPSGSANAIFFLALATPIYEIILSSGVNCTDYTYVYIYIYFRLNNKYSNDFFAHMFSVFVAFTAQYKCVMQIFILFNLLPNVVDNGSSI